MKHYIKFLLLPLFIVSCNSTNKDLLQEALLKELDTQMVLLQKNMEILERAERGVDVQGEAWHYYVDTIIPLDTPANISGIFHPLVMGNNKHGYDYILVTKPFKTRGLKSLIWEGWHIVGRSTYDYDYDYAIYTYMRN